MKTLNDLDLSAAQKELLTKAGFSLDKHINQLSSIEVGATSVQPIYGGKDGRQKIGEIPIPGYHRTPLTWVLNQIEDPIKETDHLVIANKLLDNGVDADKADTRPSPNPPLQIALSRVANPELIRKILTKVDFNKWETTAKCKIIDRCMVMGFSIKNSISLDEGLYGQAHKLLQATSLKNGLDSIPDNAQCHFMSSKREKDYPIKSPNNSFAMLMVEIYDRILKQGKRGDDIKTEMEKYFTKKNFPAHTSHWLVTFARLHYEKLQAEIKQKSEAPKPDKTTGDGVSLASFSASPSSSATSQSPSLLSQFKSMQMNNSGGASEANKAGKEPTPEHVDPKQKQNPFT